MILTVINTLAQDVIKNFIGYERKPEYRVEQNNNTLFYFFLFAQKMKSKKYMFIFLVSLCEGLQYREEAENGIK